MNTGAREELAVPASYTTPAMLNRPHGECSTTTISVFLSCYCITNIKHLCRTSINRIQLITGAPELLFPLSSGLIWVHVAQFLLHCVW